LEENISINGIFLTKFLHVNSKSEKTSEFRPPIRRHLCRLSYKTNVYCGYSPIGFIYWCTKTGFLVITAPQGGEMLPNQGERRLFKQVKQLPHAP